MTENAYESARSLLELLEKHGFAARFVGGCVRDRLLGVEPKDYDIGSPILPDECLKLLRGAGIKVIPTGVDHGTVTAIIGGHSIEVTTLREDVLTDGRRAVVKFGKSFEIDAARRDFTINSLSEDLSGTVYDYYDGRRHLKEKKLVFVGDPEKRIREDYLRILRLYRFQARFGFSFDPGLEGLMSSLKEGLSHVSQERIRSEFEEILASSFASQALKSLMKTGILIQLFPFATDESLQKFVTYTEEMREFDGDALYLFRLSALLLLRHFDFEGPSLSSEIGSFAHEAKLSNVLKRRIEILVNGFLRVKKDFKDQASFLLFAKSCERDDHSEFYRDVCTPFWLQMASYCEDKKSVKEKVEKNLLLYSVKRDLLREPPPLSTKEVMKLLDLKEGASLGKILEERTRVFLNEDVRTPEEMCTYLLRKFS